jgi:hypothetical protein
MPAALIPLIAALIGLAVAAALIHTKSNSTPLTPKYENWRGGLCGNYL